jgi:hypothetical protein
MEKTLARLKAAPVLLTRTLNQQITRLTNEKQEFTDVLAAIDFAFTFLKEVEFDTSGQKSPPPFKKFNSPAFQGAVDLEEMMKGMFK